jgi:cytochrome d ubiquinol oxidase subunit I
MTDLFAARSQMAMSLAFHILFAVAGMAMPLFMVIAEWRHQKTGDSAWLELAKRWARGTAILFAVGAVSGTVLSFELGLLWPHFMEKAGPLIGMPFSLEGFAFFLEAIFLGIYLYGWDRVSPPMHLFSGVVVALSGLASGTFVVAVNGFMNTPAGFSVVDGEIVDIDLWQAFFNPAFFTQALHMALAAYVSVAFAALGIHAFALLRAPEHAMHKKALKLAFAVAAVAMPLQLLSGDLSAKHLAEHQPIKLAAAEAHFETERAAPLAIGGWPDEERATRSFAIEIPFMLSVLAKGDPNASVQGLLDFPREEWPPVAPVHIAFQLMVACGMGMLGLIALGLFLMARRRAITEHPLFLKLLIAGSPLGLIALEAGWVVTEVGRQPWVVRGLLKTADAVTPMPGLWVPFLTFSLLYLFLGVVVVMLLRAHVFASVSDPQGEGEG